MVSVIMPVFNAERWLAESIESVLEQSWPAVELLIVDDGSEDASLSIAHRYAGPRVTVIKQRNQGPSVARNAGLAVARGDYIQYLDADDLVAERKIELQIAALTAHPARVASCAWGRFVDTPSAVQLSPSLLWSNLAPVDFLVTAYTHNVFMPNHAWLVPRAIANRAGEWPPMRSRNDDAHYFAKVLLESEGTVFVPDARAYYRSGHAGLSAAMDRSAIEGYRWTLDRISEHLLAHEDSVRSRAALATSYDHFVNAVAERYPMLAAEAEARVRELAGTRFAPLSARRGLRTLTRLLGRGATRQLVETYRRIMRKVA